MFRKKTEVMPKYFGIEFGLGLGNKVRVRVRVKVQLLLGTSSPPVTFSLTHPLGLSFTFRT